MKMSSRGNIKGGDRKKVRHFAHQDAENITVYGRNVKDVVSVNVIIFADRRFDLELTPDEIVRFLLALHPSSIASAVAKAGEEIDLFRTLPEIVKQLAAGAIPTSVAESE